MLNTLNKFLKNLNHDIKNKGVIYEFCTDDKRCTITGYAHGYKNGVKERCKEVAKNMLKDNCPINEIVRILKLDEAEINNLKNTIQQKSMYNTLNFYCINTYHISYIFNILKNF
ncbi:MAG: hypothetical protein IKN64_00215 [Desulfovibrio sp.]|nr:hypothetical protein [Desulfovibrio sp.]